MRMTHQTAYSLGLDAANDQMRQAGRIAWNEDDAELAAHTMNLHFPLCGRARGESHEHLQDHLLSGVCNAAGHTSEV